MEYIRKGKFSIMGIVIPILTVLQKYYHSERKLLKEK